MLSGCKGAINVEEFMSDSSGESSGVREKVRNPGTDL